MSSESSSGANSSSRSSSDSSSSESRTSSQVMPERKEAQTPNTQDDNMASAFPIESVRGPSHVEANEEADVDVEIMEEGEKAKVLGQCQPPSRAGLL